MMEINTERLIMRNWRESDLAPWAAMNADPEVRQYLGPLLTFEQASGWVLSFQDDLDRYGLVSGPSRSAHPASSSASPGCAP